MEVLLALASGVLYAAGIYLMLRRRLAQLIIGLGLLVERDEPADLHRGRADACAATCRAGGRRTAGAALRRSGPAGARPHRDRDRLRPAGVLAGAGRIAFTPRSGTDDVDDVGQGTVRALVLPILVPLTTAAILLLAPKRPLPAAMDRAGRVDPPAGERGPACSGGSRRRASRCCRSAAGRRRSASRWSPICSRRCSSSPSASSGWRSPRRHSPAWIRVAKRSATTR